jgi:hypothetical protein
MAGHVPAVDAVLATETPSKPCDASMLASTAAGRPGASGEVVRLEIRFPEA